jgi:transcriptional regulator with XRE-family HTH domain
MGKRSPIEHREAVAKLLRNLRNERSLKQEDLAARLSRPQSFVSKYEHGQRRLDVLELREVLQALGSTLSAFAARLERELREVGPGTLPQRFGERRQRS